MKLINKIGDWIVAKNYRYYIVQWFLYTFMFLSSTFAVACFLSLLIK